MIPSTLPSIDRSGPPLLPGFSGAVWAMTSYRRVMESGPAISPVVATTPVCALRGYPMATTGVSIAGAGPDSQSRTTKLESQQIARTATSLSELNPRRVAG